MSSTGDAAEQIVGAATNITVKGVECVANLAGKGAINLATFLVATIRQQKKSNGKARIKTFNGKPTSVFVMRNEDMQIFSKQAKEYGILYAAIFDKNAKDDPNGLVDVVVNSNDAARVNRISDKFALSAEEVDKIRNDIIKDREKKEKQGENKERTTPPAEKTHTVDDNTLGEIMKEQPQSKTEHKQPEEVSQQNPTKAGMEKRRSNPSAPLSENSRDTGEEISRSERPSVRQQIKELKEERKTVDSRPKQRERSKTQQTVHKQPQRNKKSKSKER